jgi:phosphotransferase system HPr (HPr) family protein
MVVNELGLHARAASQIARTARDAVSSVWIIRGEDKADACSTLDILTLACAMGSRLTLSVENPVDRHILDELVRLFETGFGE